MNDFVIWLKAAGIRAVKTTAQTAAGMLAAAQFFADVQWQMLISAALLSGLLSILTSIAGLPEVKQLKGGDLNS